MNKQKKVTLKVTCAYDENHKFPIVIDVLEKKSKKGADENPATIDVFCPFCGKYSRVTIPGVLVEDKNIYRSFGFDKV